MMIWVGIDFHGNFGMAKKAVNNFSDELNNCLEEKR